MVGPTGFEPATPSPPAKCATRLRYGPTQKRRKMPELMYGSSLYRMPMAFQKPRRVGTLAPLLLRLGCGGS